MSSSIRRLRSVSCSFCPVGLNEIFDYSRNTIMDDFRQREELSCNYICMYFPNLVQDWEGLRNALDDGVGTPFGTHMQTNSISRSQAMHRAPNEKSEQQLPRTEEVPGASPKTSSGQMFIFRELDPSPGGVHGFKWPFI